MQLKIELEQPCLGPLESPLLCNEGILYDYASGDGFGSCPDCGGRGKVPSPIGVEILEFVKYWTTMGYSDAA